MKFTRHFTKAHSDPYHGIRFVRRQATIREQDGRVVFSAEVEVPDFWSEVATEVLASKYLRRGESSLRQAIERMVQAWTSWGERLGVFSTPNDAAVYADEMRYQIVHQMASPNSPQWFNTGVFERPQAHACFIQSVQDNLVGPGGIMDLWQREARLFKYGSGTGTCFSALRAEGEPLSEGGTSSGLLSFLKIGDAAAGAIRSGGTTRRAAKMVCVDADHPDILAFIQWKAREERKVAALITGSRQHRQSLEQVWKACFEPGGVDPKANPRLAESLEKARAGFVSENYLLATLDCARAGKPFPKFPVFDTDWRHEAYQSVSGQNSNNSVRVTDGFMKAVQERKNWSLKWRTNGGVARELPARQLWEEIASSAWECADPGLQFDTTINAWHTCPGDGRIRASNPCSEYLFLDDTACNLASLNLAKFDKHGVFDIAAFQQAVRCWVVTLDITVSMASYPSETIARRSEQYRTLGLGYANLGSLLMQRAVPYGSPPALALTAGITALMTAQAYGVSAELAGELGAFERFTSNREPMLQVLEKHQRALRESTAFDTTLIPQPIAQAAREAWEAALASGRKSGYRNAQVSAIAPTGTIGLVMDCDTMGIEPEFALVKYKKLAGGGFLRTRNRSVGPALMALGYSPEQGREIESFLEAQGTVEGAPHLAARDYPVFDCANRCGDKGTRVLGVLAHLQMVAAAQSFVSGGVSKTINLPSETTAEQIAALYEKAWQLGLKSISIYRAGSKLSQPLGSVIDKDDPSCVECG